MKIIVLARLTARSGNNSTAIRISEHLLSNGHEVLLKCVSSYESTTQLNTYVERNGIDLIIGIHALRAGRLIYDCAVPFFIIFGGTDLNVHYKERSELEIMTKAVKEAIRCIAFNSALKHRASSLWADSSHKIVIQPQAVEIFNVENEESSLENIFISAEISCKTLLNNNAIIFLLVAGLRPVKDPLFLVGTFSAWHQEDNRIHLIIVGPEIDLSYSAYFKETIHNYAGVIFINGLFPKELHHLMLKAFAAVNTSISEGMASSILEAMALGVPTIARRNDGNSAIIEHRVTGLLFDSPEEFRSLAEELLSSDNARRCIVENAKKCILDRHSLENERSVYCELIQSIQRHS